MKATIRIFDEVNCELSGIKKLDMKHLIKKTSIRDPKAFTTAAYKLGTWDGLVPFIVDDITFTFLIPQISKILKQLDYDVEIIDESPHLGDKLPNITIDDKWLLKETGKILRPHQVNGTNIVLRDRKGVLEYSTSSGKTLLCMCISKAIDPYMKSVIIVPNQQLLDQTYKDYKLTELSVAKLSSAVSAKNREAMIMNHRHIIITEKLFSSLVDIFARETYAIIKDETQQFGEVLMESLRFDMPHAPIRIGLTGSFPRDKLKATKIKCHLGGDIIDVVQPDDMKQLGATAKEHISIIKTVHPEISDIFSQLDDNKSYDWTVEQDYIHNNKDRVKAIAEFIKELPTTNTLVLCHAQFGLKLSEHMGIPMIDGDTKTEIRAEYFGIFDICDDNHIQLASYGCAATGISVNRIHRVIVIDIGKNGTYILQSIGRGLRQSDVQDHIEVIDIYADLKYGNNHLVDRISIYKEKKFSYDFIDNEIKVKSK